MKIGDQVTVTRKAVSHENGWGNGWNSDMDQFVGKTGTVTYVDTVRKDVGVKFSGHTRVFGYPDFILSAPVLVNSVFSVGDRVQVSWPYWQGEGIIERIYKFSGDIAVKMSTGPKAGNEGAFSTRYLSLLSPVQPTVKIDAQTVATVAPVVKPVLAVGSRVQVKYRGWEGEGIVDELGSPWTKIRLITGPHKGQSGAFVPVSEFEVIAGPEELKPSFQPAPAPASTQKSITPSYPVPAATLSRRSQAAFIGKNLARQLALANSDKRIHIDHVQAELQKLGYLPTELGNAAGSVFSGKSWRNTGVTVKSQRPGNHSRRVVIWEYIGA